MPPKRQSLKNKLESSFRMVVFVSLIISVSLAYLIFSLSISSSIDPQILKASKLTDTRLLIILAVANLVALGVSRLLAAKHTKNLVEPILAIKAGAEIIGEGNLDYTIDVSTNDEVEDLAVAFNTMSKKLNTLLSEVSTENDEISAERNKFLVVIEGVLDGIITLDYGRKISLVNKAALGMLGLQESDLIGKKFDDLILIFKNKTKLSALDFCPLTPVDQDKVVFQDKNLKMVTPKKELFISMISASIKGGKLANLGCIITFRDSTKETEMEEMKIDFVSMAAHELRTPLTTIRGYASLLEPKLQGKITPEESTFLERISISATQLSALVENLLDVSKIEHSSLEIEPAEEDWVKLVKTAVLGFEEFAKQKNIDLKYIEPTKKLPSVFVDVFRIAEVISNLVANAITYSKGNGKVEVRTYEEKGMVVTSVKDNGIGIPEKSIPHLFTKFYRVSGVLEQGSKGTGLGLYISKSIVNMHKGDIWVESELGVGSTFYFTVPVFKQDKTS